MVPMIRSGILAASGATNDPNEDFSGESEVVTLFASNSILTINCLLNFSQLMSICLMMATIEISITLAF